MPEEAWVSRTERLKLKYTEIRSIDTRNDMKIEAITICSGFWQIISGCICA